MTAAELLRTIAVLLVALCAPARLTRRLRALSVAELWRFAIGLEEFEAAGYVLRRRGDSLSVVIRRLDWLVWISRDPFAALKHMTRRKRGLARLRAGASLPPPVAPPARARPAADAVLRRRPAHDTS